MRLNNKLSFVKVLLSNKLNFLLGRMNLQLRMNEIFWDDVLRFVAPFLGAPNIIFTLKLDIISQKIEYLELSNMNSEVRCQIIQNHVLFYCPSFIVRTNSEDGRLRYEPNYPLLWVLSDQTP